MMKNSWSRKKRRTTYRFICMTTAKLHKVCMFIRINRIIESIQSNWHEVLASTFPLVQIIGPPSTVSQQRMERVYATWKWCVCVVCGFFFLKKKKGCKNNLDYFLFPIDSKWASTRNVRWPVQKLPVFWQAQQLCLWDIQFIHTWNPYKIQIVKRKKARID